MNGAKRIMRWMWTNATFFRHCLRLTIPQKEPLFNPLTKMGNFIQTKVNKPFLDLNLWLPDRGANKLSLCYPAVSYDKWLLPWKWMDQCFANNLLLGRSGKTIYLSKFLSLKSVFIKHGNGTFLSLAYFCWRRNGGVC